MDKIQILTTKGMMDKDLLDHTSGTTKFENGTVIWSQYTLNGEIVQRDAEVILN
jgi:hypothetical protein